MPKIVKVVRKPTYSLGIYLQEKANKMLKKGNTGEEYTRTRKAAEWHLRMWAWQRTTPAWKLPGQTKDFEAPSCHKVGCRHLPAGSEQCRAGECP